MILAEDEKSDLSQVATSHLIRLIIIITIFPFIVNSFYEVEKLKIVDEVLSNQNLAHLLILIASSITLIFLFCFADYSFAPTLLPALDRGFSPLAV